MSPADTRLTWRPRPTLRSGGRSSPASRCWSRSLYPCYRWFLCTSRKEKKRKKQNLMNKVSISKCSILVWGDVQLVFNGTIMKRQDIRQYDIIWYIESKIIVEVRVFEYFPFYASLCFNSIFFIFHNEALVLLLKWRIGILLPQLFLGKKKVKFEISVRTPSGHLKDCIYVTEIILFVMNFWMSDSIKMYMKQYTESLFCLFSIYKCKPQHAIPTPKPNYLHSPFSFLTASSLHMFNF